MKPRKKFASRTRIAFSYPWVLLGFCLIPMLLNTSLAQTAEWPPTLDAKNTITQSLDGRRIERYTHGAFAGWGYPEAAPDEWKYSAGQESAKLGQNHNSFYLVFPKKPRKQAPLCVVLHSANRTGFDYMGLQFLNRKIDPADEPADVMTRVPDDCYALYLNSTNEEWWGWIAAHENPSKYRDAFSPAEKRVLDTIEWVITRYKIDRNRVYLSGVSMGGCGALGIGLPHGNIFAAMLVMVPAGTEFAALRMGFAAAAGGSSPASSSEWPDPPVLVDFSAQNDDWSKTQPELLHAAQAEKFPLVVAWAPFGHTAFSTAIAKYPQADVTLAFPWTEIRKNVAYPVFTNASSDQRSRWTGAPAAFDESGQINAYFRWKNQEDTSSKFAIKLWIDHPIVKDPPASMPETAIADVAFRRLQAFKVVPGKIYKWQLVRKGKTVASGKVAPDAANLLTISNVMLSIAPAELSIREEITK